MTSTREKVRSASKTAYLPPLIGNYRLLADSRFKSKNGSEIEIQRFYSKKPSASKYSIIRISPSGERERLSGIFPTSNPLAYSFDLKDRGNRQYYIIEFDKYYKTAEVRLA